MSKYRKKPVIIEAFRWTADIGQVEDPEWIIDAIKNGTVYFLNVGTALVTMYIITLEGTMIAKPGDWIIQGIHGELYPCKHDIFKQTYEAIND